MILPVTVVQANCPKFCLLALNFAMLLLVASYKPIVCRQLSDICMALNRVQSVLLRISLILNYFCLSPILY